MGAGVVGAWPACLFPTRRGFVTAALLLELMCMSYTRAKTQCVHTMVILQTITITLHTSQKLAQRICCWAQCTSNCWEKCLAPLFLTAMCVEIFGELSADFPQLGLRSGGICFLQGWVFLPLTWAFVSRETYERAGPFVSCCHGCASVSPPQQVPQVVKLH